ncbi:MAG: serine hydrolase domain-containing protein [Pseudohongiellaceae bacterium]
MKPRYTLSSSVRHSFRLFFFTARAFITIGFIATTTVFAAEIPSASPEEVGMSSERLKQIEVVMQRHLEAGDIQGAVTVVARRGKLVHFQTHGLMDVGNQRAMQDDSLFIMMSSTKPVLGVATMMMVEQGLLRPEDPVSKYIPEFADMQVAVLKDAAEDISPLRVDPNNAPDHRLVPAKREITIHDLLTHTSGLASGGLGTAIQKRQPRSLEATLETQMPVYASYALDFQPGERWSYSPGVGLDVVARIVEIVSGQPFDEFLQEHIFEPLDMNNTYFNVPAEYQDRRVVISDRDMSRFFDRPPTKYFSASGGLTSSAEDYLKFEQMLVNGGELFGNRLLSPRTVRMMGSNQIGDLYRGFSRNQEGMGFGYTVGVTVDPITSNARRSAGAFGWGGAFGTRSWTDPEEELTAVIMLQQPHSATQYDFENAVQQAIIE